MTRFWTRLLILHVFTLQALFVVGLPQTASAAWKDKPTTDSGGYITYGKETAAGQAKTADPSLFAPQKMREWYGRNQNSSLIRMPANLLNLFLVTGAISMLKCMSSIAESPNCDELRGLLDNSPYILASTFIFTFLTGSQNIFAATPGVIPMAVKQSVMMSAAMIVAQFATDGMVALANSCYTSELKANQNTPEALNARAQCEKLYKQWSIDGAISKSVPAIPALIASVYAPRLGAMLYNKTLEKAASWALLAFVFKKESVNAFLHGSTPSAKFVFGAISIASQFLVYGLIQDAFSMPWRRETLAHSNLISTVVTPLIYSAPTAYLFGHMGFDVDKYRVAHGLPKTEKPRTAGETVADVEEVVLREYGNWARNQFQYKHFDEKTCEVTPGSNGKRVCEYPMNFSDMLQDYSRIQNDFRRLNIEKAWQSYYAWKVKLDRYWQVYQDTYKLYAAALTMLAEAKKEKRYNVAGELVFPAEAPQILQAALSPEDPQLPPFEAPQFGYATTPSRAPYIVAAAACGPFLQNLDLAQFAGGKNWRKHPSIETGSLLRGPIHFKPPAIVKPTRSTICDYKPADNVVSGTYEKTNVWDGQWQIPGQQKFYTGLLSYLAANVDESLLPTQNAKGEWELTAFDDFWISKLVVPTMKMWEEFRDPYQELIKGEFFEAMFRKDYSHCFDSNRKRHDATLFANLSPEREVCQDRGRRLVNGPSVRTRLAIGIAPNIYEEMRFKSQMLEFFYYSFQGPETGEAALKAYRAREKVFLQLVKDLTQSDFTKDDRFELTRAAAIALLRQLSMLFGMNLDQVEELAQKKPEEVDLSGKTPVEKASANRLYIAARLVTDMNNLLVELANYHLITNGVGGMESPIKDVVDWRAYSVVPNNWLLSIMNGLGWITFQHYPKAK